MKLPLGWTLGWLCSFAMLGLVSSADGASRGSPEVARLADEYWQGTLRANPVMATSIGDHRYDAFLGDNSPIGTQRDRVRLASVLGRARALDERPLSAADRMTRSALILEVQNALDQIDCRFEEWVVDPLNGPQVAYMNLPDITRFKTPADASSYVRRCRLIPRAIDQEISNLTRGLDAGKTAAHDQVRKSIEELDALLAQPVEQWGMLTPLKSPHDEWPLAARESFHRDLIAVANDRIRPAYERYRDFLEKRILPAARPQDRAGLYYLPGGVEAYKKCIRIQTSLDKTPEELHQLGLEQVAKFRHDLAALGKKALGTSDIPTIQAKLRNDPAMQFKNAAEIEAKARATLSRAQAAVPKWFGIQPKASCEVKVMGMHEAPNSTIAYYQPLAPDGSRPGYYMINTYKPETRPRYEAEALAFHESVPGHHLQIAIAEELKDLPEFRKYQGTTAFVEGWALYTERLADEMGLYSSDTDRIGMLSYDAWRSCRLVVDTGMHAMGWSRQRAIDYMKENSVLAENNIVNEVDRYLSWPGQALAYKCGQLEILALRDEGRRRLGDRFDIKAFHDVVLRNGAVALPVLRQEVEAYYASMEKAR